MIMIIKIDSMSNQRQLRTKRNSFIINLVQTTHGFSIVEGVELLNKTDGPVAVQPHSQQSMNHVQPLHSTNTPKETKPIFKKTNLVFHRQPSITHNQPQAIAQTDFPPLSSCAQWFDFQRLHQIEKKEVTQWLCEKYKITFAEAESREEFKQTLSLYQSQRNFIVSLYLKDYSEDHKYLSANTIRKYLSGDAFWLSRIHLFLTKHGIINTTSNLAFQSNTQAHTFKTTNKSKQSLIPYQLDISIKIPSLQLDQNRILKQLTSELRPYCDFCRVHCGIVWFQHNRSLDPKQIANIMKNVNSKNPPLSQKQYEYVLCVRCYCENHFPLLLTYHDFKKMSINDKIEPSRKKKSKRRKREKRKREVEDQGEEQAKENGSSDKSHHPQEEQIQRKEQVNALIQRLAASTKAHLWHLEETALLLELVEKYEEDWVKIHQVLKRHGYCRDMETEEIISYFLSLPRRGISRLYEQYEDQQLIETNFSYNHCAFGGRLAERKLEDAILFSHQVPKQVEKKLKLTASVDSQRWLPRLEGVTRLQMEKLGKRIDRIEQRQQIMKQLKEIRDRL